MQKDYHDMTDKEKLTYVLEDIGIEVSITTEHTGIPTVSIAEGYNDVEFGFDQDGDFVSFIVY